MPETLTVDFDNHVAVVSLARPDKRNAVNLAMFEELSACGRELADRKGLRAVVLRGEGEHFCAGIDTSVFADGEPANLAERMRPLEGTPANLFQHAALVWRELPVPVIAALKGVVYGAGLQIAMGADMRVASPSTRCSVMEIRWGIIPDMGLTVTMRDVVRQDCLRDLTYSGRVVEAEEARALGLVTVLSDDPDAHASAIAAEIAERSPDAIRAAKSLFATAFDDSPTDSLRREAALQLAVLGRPNQQEAATANVEQRQPRFRD